MAEKSATAPIIAAMPLPRRLSMGDILHFSLAAPYATRPHRKNGECPLFSCSPSLLVLQRKASVPLTRPCSALHRVEEVRVGLGIAHLVDQELGSGQLVHRMQQLAQDPDLLQLIRLRDELLAARARAVDVERRVDTLLRDAPVEMNLAIAGALELLVDDVVHARAGVDQRGRQDRE